MSKFATRPTNVRAPIATTGQRMCTHEGAVGFERDAKSALFLLAVSNMVSEQTFYENADARDERFEKLIHQVVTEDEAWVAAFVPYLRDTMQMRSASIVLAAEYVKAGGKNGRRLVDAAIRRADEPGEMLAYWRSRHGRSIPAAVKRGVADACRRLYTERNVLKYDGQARAWRFADVIETVHAKPNAEWQSTLWKFLLDERHHGDGKLEGGETLLRTIQADRILRAAPEDSRRSVMHASIESGLWETAAWSWERLSGWLPGGMDAEAWESVIPQMGYMALLRNLRNFDEAGVSDQVAAEVMLKLSDADEVAKSRQFPIRFYSAFKNIGSLRWAAALELALDAAVRNVPAMPGRNLVLIDTSRSMEDTLSGRSTFARYEVAALFGAAIARVAVHADLVLYASSSENRNDLLRQPLLRQIDNVRASIGRVGHGTATFASLAENYDRHDRVFILTDEQSRDGGYNLPDVPIYTFNLAGYGPAHLASGERNRYTFGGLTDAAFRLVPSCEGAASGRWPFLA